MRFLTLVFLVSVSPLVAQHPKAEAGLTPASFSTEGLTHENTLTSIYRGDFNDLDFNRDDTLFEALFEEYLKAFAQQCAAALPANKVEMTRTECDAGYYWANRYGLRKGGDICTHYGQAGTGLYADPFLYGAKIKLDNIVASNALHETFRMMAQANADKNPGGPAMRILNQIETFRSDMNELLKRNQCTSAGVKRFEQNVVQFALGKPPIRLASVGGGSAGPNQPATVTLGANQNYKKLVDDLIVEQSKTWIMNRYMAGSVASVDVAGRDAVGRPTKLVAQYVYNGNRPGSVTVEFTDGLPDCMYFFDLPASCRTADHRVVAAFLKGSYQNR